MSKKFLIANWKMKLNAEESIQLAKDLKTEISKAKFGADKEIAVAPDFLSWQAVAKILKSSKVNMACQNAWYEDKGSFTGEISLAMLKDLGCQYAILGHSERRAFSGETDELVNKKVATALKHDMTPVVCVGETFEQRKEGRKDVVIMRQVQEALREIDIKPEQTLIVAYEPVWAIGSGQAMNPAEAEHTAMIIKQSLIDVLEHQDLPLVKIVYGGSVDSKNVASFTNIDVIDGALIGGASLDAKEFINLIKKA
ncbi:triose-phosphate isomerase [bacterium]|jgi:triosephosphate isomerase (TIM)|nr:triose-phosphate isomerase [bacterium]MBT4649114.1 triose-phosphate isomerase [bacterium]